MQGSVDVIVPARDEAGTIGAVVAALRGRGVRQVVVVDNGSTDATAARAETAGAAVIVEPNRGYGAACLAGLAALGQGRPPPETVAFFDADLSDDPDWLPSLCADVESGETDLAIGTRTRRAERGALTPVQRFGNGLACGLIALATGRRYRDLGPMRAVRLRSLQALHMSDRTWGWTVEMQYKAAAAGLRVSERDVPYRPRHAGRSKISGSLRGSAEAGARILSTVARLWRTYPPKGRTMSSTVVGRP